MSSSTSLRIASLDSEPPMEVSKWLKIQVLLDFEEMVHLFEALGEFEIYLTGTVTKVGEGRVPKLEFITIYKGYVQSLIEGKLPDDSIFRSYFNAILTTSSDLLYSIPVLEGRQLIRASKPVIQLQSHSMDYSVHDGKFRPMIFGRDSIPWGIQFSYPQLFLDPNTKEILQIKEDETFPNTHLFRKLQKWIRKQTIPTSFQVENHKINVPMRLGKCCLTWINNHVQLCHKKIKVL
jgi:hypothetical protein